MVSGSYVKQVLGRMPESPETRAGRKAAALRGELQLNRPVACFSPSPMAIVRAGSDCCLLFYRQGLGLRGQRQDPGREGGNPRQAGGGAQIEAGLVPIQPQLYKAFNTTLS